MGGGDGKMGGEGEIGGGRGGAKGATFTKDNEEHSSQ